LFNASVKENLLNVHIWTPNLNPAVEPFDSIAVVSVFTELLSDEAGGDWDPLHAAIITITRKKEIMQANRFICYVLTNYIRFSGKFDTIRANNGPST
jgi:hypothetical protein